MSMSVFDVYSGVWQICPRDLLWQLRYFVGTQRHILLLSAATKW
jgi:hypothetical protein